MNLPRPGDTKYDILVAINEHWKLHPKGPTVEELRKTVGLTRRSSVQFHIDDLKSMDLVENLPRRARSLRPTSRGKKLLKVMANFGEDLPPGIKQAHGQAQG